MKIKNPFKRKEKEVKPSEEPKETSREKALQRIKEKLDEASQTIEEGKAYLKTKFVKK